MISNMKTTAALFLFLATVLGAQTAGPADAPKPPVTPPAAPLPGSTPAPAAPVKAPESAPASPAPSIAANPAPAPLKPGAPVKEGDYTGKVVVIPVGEEDLINPARFEFMSRTLKRATEEGAEAVVFDLNTPGGIAWQTATLMMTDLEKLGCRSISFVNPRAMSAGALISIATDAIYMSPVSSIGAATPVNSDYKEMGKDERAKINSGYMGMARAAAKRKLHNPGVIEAMIDMDAGLKMGKDEICKKGSILTLDQEQATKIYDGKPLLAKGIVKDLAELRQREGLKGQTIIAEPHGFERVAILIAQWASILILIGLAGIYLEFQHPGMLIPGVIAAIAFGLFFFGHYVAGSLAGYETLVIFLVGLILIAVEFFIFPGHVIPGLTGLLMVLGALLYTMAGWDNTVPAGGKIPVDLSAYALPLRNLGVAFVGAIFIIAMLMRYLPGVGPFKLLVLQTSVGGAQAAIEGHAQALAEKVRIGDTGVTRSAMRPAGNVAFGPIHIEAFVEGGYLPPDTPVRVVSLGGGRVIVEKA
jgi:membrane-bound serine protease (ClpP class)